MDSLYPWLWAGEVLLIVRVFQFHVIHKALGKGLSKRHEAQTRDQVLCMGLAAGIAWIAVGCDDLITCVGGFLLDLYLDRPDDWETLHSGPGWIALLTGVTLVFWCAFDLRYASKLADGVRENEHLTWHDKWLYFGWLFGCSPERSKRLKELDTRVLQSIHQDRASSGLKKEIPQLLRAVLVISLFRGFAPLVMKWFYVKEQLTAVQFSVPWYTVSCLALLYFYLRSPQRKKTPPLTKKRGIVILTFSLSAWVGIWLSFHLWGKQSILFAQAIMMGAQAFLPTMMGLFFFDEIKKIRAMGNRARRAVIVGTLGATLVALSSLLG